MIRIEVGNTMKRNTVIKEATETPQSILESQGFTPDYTSWRLAGKTLTRDDYFKTFEDLGVPDGGYVSLINIVKTDNA